VIDIGYLKSSAIDIKSSEVIINVLLFCEPGDKLIVHSLLAGRNRNADFFFVVAVPFGVPGLTMVKKNPPASCWCSVGSARATPTRAANLMQTLSLPGEQDFIAA